MKYYLSRSYTVIHITDEAHKDDLLFGEYPVVIETEKLEDLISVLGLSPTQFCDCAKTLNVHKPREV